MVSTKLAIEVRVVGGTISFSARMRSVIDSSRFSTSSSEISESVYAISIEW